MWQRLYKFANSVDHLTPHIGNCSSRCCGARRGSRRQRKGATSCGRSPLATSIKDRGKWRANGKQSGREDNQLSVPLALPRHRRALPNATLKSNKTGACSRFVKGKKKKEPASRERVKVLPRSIAQKGKKIERSKEQTRSKKEKNKKDRKRREKEDSMSQSSTKSKRAAERGESE